MQGTVVIGSTISVCRIFASGVVKRSTFFANQLFRAGIVTESTIQKNSFLWLLYLTLFKNPTQNCDRRIFAQKIFFCVVTPRTWLFPAQLCGYSRHNRVGTRGTFLL